MYKKAGIIVGIALFVIAGLLYWWFATPHGKSGGGAKSSPASSIQQPAPTKPSSDQTNPVQQPVQQPQPTPVQTAIVQTQPVVEAPKKVFMEVDDAQVKNELGDPVTTRKELMLVAKKKLVVMDSDVASKDGKQMVYAVDLMGNNNSTRITVYLNGVAYKGVSVGDRLTVEYSIYKNKAGVELPVVINVEKPQ